MLKRASGNTELEILNAIGELDENSSACPDDVPVMFVIKTKEALAYPLKILLRKSLDEGIIPDVHKLANITPIHKGGANKNISWFSFKPLSIFPVKLICILREIKQLLMWELSVNV